MRRVLQKMFPCISRHMTSLLHENGHRFRFSCVSASAQGEATIPSNLGEEKATNPFLRPRDPAIRQLMGFDSEADDWRVFAAIRAAKDRF